MLRKIRALSVLCAMAFSNPTIAQQYRAPPDVNLTGGGLAPATQGEGSGLSQPAESVGGGVNNPPYSSYGFSSPNGVTGGGLNAASQGAINNGPGPLAPNGETYKSLGISGY